MGGHIILALSYISVRTDKKKQQQQMKGWFKTSGRTKSSREKEEKGADAVQRQMPRGGVVSDEVERHDFRNKSI